MRKAPISLQDLRRRLYIKAKTEPTWRFWGLYVHVCKQETLREAYRLTKANDGAPGIDGVTFAVVEAEGPAAFLDQLRKELMERTYRPQRARKVEKPKDGNKVRVLSIPSIRDRVVPGALKLILEPIFEADFQPGSYGYRPKKSAHAAIQRVKQAILEGKTYVIDFDLRSYFDTVKHYIVLEKVARRVDDSAVLWPLKLLLQASGKRNALFGVRAEAQRRAAAALSLYRSRDADYGPAFALALLHDSAQVHKIKAALEHRFPEDTSVQFSYLPTLRALEALIQGQAAKAVEMTQAATPYDLAVPRTAAFTNGFFGALYPAYVRGLAYSQMGRHREAAAEFQKILDNPGIVLNDPIGPIARLQLARALSLAGDHAKSTAAYRDLLGLWKDADSDISVIQEAKAEAAKL